MAWRQLAHSGSSDDPSQQGRRGEKALEALQNPERMAELTHRLHVSASLGEHP